MYGQIFNARESSCTRPHYVVTSRNREISGTIVLAASASFYLAGCINCGWHRNGVGPTHGSEKARQTLSTRQDLPLCGAQNH